jgi:hypothetical protein
MLYPANLGVEPPNEDLSYEVKTDYHEAANIVDKSPRAAAALLRLAVQKLSAQLDEKGKNLNNDIASLVKKGLPAKIQQSLDIVRVVGNNAVHPGQMDLKDDKQTATTLFNLINLIADAMITQPKHVEEVFQTLPQSSREEIARRDQSDAA